MADLSRRTPTSAGPVRDERSGFRYVNLILSGLSTWVREKLLHSTLFKRFSSDSHTVGHGATRTRRAYRATDSSHEGSLRNMDTLASTKTFLDDVRVIYFGQFYGLHVTYAVSDGGASFAQVP